MKFLKSIISSSLLVACCSLQAQEVRISAGTNVIVDDNAQIVLNGMGLNNSGNYRALSGTLVFTGLKADGAAYISGSSFPVLHHLKVDRASSDLQLNTRVFVNGNLELVAGNIDLNNYSVDLGSTGKLIGESRNTRVLGNNGGFIKTTALISRGENIEPGNLGLQINSNDNLGTTTIIRGHLQQRNKDGELSIERYYEIDPAFQVNNKINVRANFLDVESTNPDIQQLVLWSSDDAGRNWKPVKTGVANYELTKSDGLNNMRVTYFTKKVGGNALNNAYIQLYPNPVREQFTLSYYSADEEDVIVNLYSKNGQLLEAKKVRMVPGLNKLDWNVGKYAAGSYQLRVLSRNGKNLSFVKE